MPLYGKTHSRFITIEIEDAGGVTRNITNSIDKIGNVGLEYAKDSITTFASLVEEFLLGYGSSELDMGGPMNNTPVAAAPAESGAHIVMSGLNGGSTGRLLTIKFGIRAAPAAGDPKWSGTYIVSSYMAEPGGGIVRWSSKLGLASGAALPAWGTV